MQFRAVRLKKSYQFSRPDRQLCKWRGWEEWSRIRSTGGYMGGRQQCVVDEDCARVHRLCTPAQDTDYAHLHDRPPLTSTHRMKERRSICRGHCAAPSGNSYELLQSRLQVFVQSCQELFRCQPLLIRSDQSCQILRHLAALDSLDDDVFKGLRKLGHFRR